MMVKIPMPETTDMTLFVRSKGEEVDRWNRRRIVDALIRETGIDVATAEAVSIDVEKGLFASGVSVLTTSLIRELVDAKLVERGLEKARRMHARLGFPLYDVDQLILHHNKEDANVPHGPEGTNLVLARGSNGNTPCTASSPRRSATPTSWVIFTSTAWDLWTVPSRAARIWNI